MSTQVKDVVKYLDSFESNPDIEFRDLMRKTQDIILKTYGSGFNTAAQGHIPDYFIDDVINTFLQKEQNHSLKNSEPKEILIAYANFVIANYESYLSNLHLRDMPTEKTQVPNLRQPIIINKDNKKRTKLSSITSLFKKPRE